MSFCTSKMSSWSFSYFIALYLYRSIIISLFADCIYMVIETNEGNCFINELIYVDYQYKVINETKQKFLSKRPWDLNSSGEFNNFWGKCWNSTGLGFEYFFRFHQTLKRKEKVQTNNCIVLWFNSLFQALLFMWVSDNSGIHKNASLVGTISYARPKNKSHSIHFEQPKIYR